MSVLMAVTNSSRPNVQAWVKQVEGMKGTYVVAYQDGDKHWIDGGWTHLQAVMKAQKHCEDVK